MALNIGILGFNYIAHDHARQVMTCPKTRLVSVADLEHGRRVMAEETYGVRHTYPDYTTLLQGDVDAVIVALPVPLHYAATMAALEAGKHVLCEKPPAASSEEAVQMVTLAREKGLVLSWGLQRRYTPAMHAARTAVEWGLLGRVYRVEAKYTLARSEAMFTDPIRMRKKGGGVFFDLGVHVLDMAWSCLGCPKPVRVTAALHTAFPHWNALLDKSDMAEDNAAALIILEDGSILDIEACFASQRPPERETGHNPTLHILGDRGGLQTPSLLLSTGQKKKVTTRVLKLRKSWQVSDRRQMIANFADAVAGRKELLIKPEHGIALMKMIEGVVASGDEGREVRLDR